MRSINQYGPVFLTLVVLLLASAPADAQQQPDAALVRVGAVKAEQVRRQRTVIGHIEPARRSIVAAEETGRVTLAPPEPGLSIKDGEVLASTDDTVLRLDYQAAAAQVQQGQALVAEQTANLEIAERNLANLLGLLESNVARQKEVDDARSELAADQARLELAQAQLRGNQAALQRLDTRLAKTQVKAPFDAHVVRKHTELGQWLEPGDPVSELVEIGRVKARLYVPQDVMPHIAPDQPIALTVDALGQTTDVKLFSIIPDADVQTRTFAILIKIDNTDGVLKPGMSVSAQLPTGQTTTALTVPRDAVITTPTGPVVYVNRGGAAALVPVNIEFGERDRFVVDGELRDGEQVVVEGNERLRPGQALKVLEDPPQAPARSER